MSRLLLLFLAVLPWTLCAQPPAADVAFTERLIGVWEGPLGDARYRETWHQHDATTFNGIAQVIANGQVVNEEQMRLMYFAGEWLFIASTGGQRITSFVRVAVRDGEWVFENREHDFPQRIGYRVQADTLSAYIALLDDQGRRQEFVLRKE
jgi:hypothetical protein